MNRRHKLLYGIGIILFVVYLVATNPFAALTEVGRFNYRIFVFAVLLNWAGLFFLAASWHMLLRVLQVRTSMWRSIQMTFVSMFVVWLLPVPSGVEIINISRIPASISTESGW